MVQLWNGSFLAVAAAAIIRVIAGHWQLANYKVPAKMLSLWAVLLKGFFNYKVMDVRVVNGEFQFLDIQDMATLS